MNTYVGFKSYCKTHGVLGLRTKSEAKEDRSVVFSRKVVEKQVSDGVLGLRAKKLFLIF